MYASELELGTGDRIRSVSGERFRQHQGGALRKGKLIISLRD